MIEGDLFEQDRNRDKISFRNRLVDYSRYWYLFAIAMAISLLAAFFHIRYSITKYYVSTTILIKDPAEGAGMSNPALSNIDMLKTTKKVDDEMIILKSRSLMETVLRELSLNKSYFLDGRLQDMEVYESALPLRVIVTQLNPDAYHKKIAIHPQGGNKFRLEENDAKQEMTHQYKFGDQITRPYAVFTVLQGSDSSLHGLKEKVIVVFHDIESLASSFSNKLEIAPVNKNSNVLRIALTDAVPKRSVDILQKLVEVYELEAEADKNLTASSALSFIDERLLYLTAELTDVERNVEEYKMLNNLTDVTSDAALYLKSADDYNKKLAEFDIQIELLRSISEYLKAKEGDQVELVPSSLNILDPTLLSLIAKFNELQLERQRMQKTTNSGNPLMVNLKAQLDNLRANIGENIKNLIQGLIITRENLIHSSAEFELRKRKVPAMERELLEINRQQGVKEGLYLYLLQKREESALALAATESNFRTIDPPSIITPIEVNRPLIMVIAFVIGLALPLALLYLKDILNDKILSARDIQLLTDTPMLGEIARSKSKDQLVVGVNVLGPIVEMFRLIRMNLRYAASAQKENQVILVTSSISGEGKSFFSINFAASLVLTGKKVIVLGMDLRKPTILSAVKVAEGLGITDFLVRDELTVSDIVRPSNALKNLYVAGSGRVSPSPTELMMSPRMEELFSNLRSSFDYIIVDSAPIGLVADAFTLAPFIDSVIYMVRRNYTPKEKLKIIEKVRREKTLKHPMIVLNDVLIGKGQNYGYGYGEDKHQPAHPVDSNVQMSNNGVATIKA